MRTQSQNRLKGLSVILALSVGLMGLAIITDAGASGFYFKKHRTTNKDLEELILMLKEQNELLNGQNVMIKEQLTTLQETIDNLSTDGGGDGGEGNHTLRWDKVLDSTNGDETTGCNSDRFKCIMPTTAFPDGEAVLDMQTGIVYDRAPHDTRGDTDPGAVLVQTWHQARTHCANRVIGGQKGQRLPSFAELASLVDPSNTIGNPDLPPSHPFIGVLPVFYWSASESFTSIGSTTKAWNVNFDTGFVFTSFMTNNDLAWCVRGGQNHGSQY